MSDLVRHFLDIRNYTESLCHPISEEDCVVQPVVFASPPKWHLAHTTWFFEAFILEKQKPGYKTYDPQFSYLFNSYYNHAGSRIARDTRGTITRPNLKEVYEYRSYVNDQVIQLLNEQDSKDLRSLVVLGLNHEQQHQELLISDLKHTFSFNPLFPIYQENGSLVEDEVFEKEFISIDEGIYEIGFKGDGFCYDNELNHHKVYLQEYEISKGLETNQDFLDFIQAGGYEDFSLWLDEGWSWVQENQIRHPIYWQQVDGQWYQYTLGGLLKIKPDAMLSHISFFEAVAFSEWKGMRLPTEMEWEVASSSFHWGKRWEWTQSAYLPYPNFPKKRGAIGEYNGKFMVNQMVLRGSSVATSPGHSRATYRNFFHPHLQWQFTGLRLAR